MRRLALLVLLIVLPACGASPMRAPTPVPTATFIPTVTFTPTFVPVGTPSPQPVTESDRPSNRGPAVAPTSNVHSSRP